MKVKIKHIAIPLTALVLTACSGEEEDPLALQPSPSPTLETTATPEATPIPTATPSPITTPTAAPSAAPTPTVAPSITPTSEPTLAPTATPTVEPSIAPTSTPTSTPTPEPTPEISPTPTAIPEPSTTPEPTITPTPEIEKSSLNIQENEDGFCKVEGSIDNNNEGYQGAGFANTDNAIQAGIEWSVQVESNGNYLLQWRFANGSAENRSGNILINGDVQANVDLNGTDGWNSWGDSEQITVYLSEGNNTIRLNADTSGGLANIDGLSIFGENLSTGECVENETPPTVEPTPSPEVTATPTPTPVPEDPDKIVNTGATPTVWYASDSTVSHYSSNSKKQQGMGQRIPEFFANEVSIANYAKYGRTMNTFTSEGHWESILKGVQPEDVVLIQFGINDSRKVGDVSVFKDYLRKYAQETIDAQAVAVFVTPTPQNKHSKGVFANPYQEYCDAIFEIAQEFGLTVIDLQEKGRNFFNQIGPDKVSDEMMTDRLHFSDQGAYQMARLLAEGISESNLAPLREQVLEDMLDENKAPTTDGWNQRDGYTHN